MIRFQRLVFAGLGVLLTASCATAILGKEDTVKFTSEPEGAAVTVRDVKRKAPAVTCVTPCELELDRKWPHGAVFELDGFESQRLMLTPTFSGENLATGLGNALTLGIGDAIDGPNAAYNDLKPNPLHAVMVPIENSDAEKNASTEIYEAVTTEGEDS